MDNNVRMTCISEDQFQKVAGQALHNMVRELEKKAIEQGKPASETCMMTLLLGTCITCEIDKLLFHADEEKADQTIV